jgi:UDP-N-acetylglucosamine--N-acetylmuramyl-(pentapeptide) pyrophosphoryl-undecaprenol N-acetylglucosamine transferase
VGSKNGPEKSLAREWGFDYSSIPVGKFRRYFDWRNFTDIFKVGFGVLKSLVVIKRFRPNVIFSKGGYVSVPVLLAGWVLRVPIVIHDSDAIPGLTTKIASRLARKICVGYESAGTYLSKSAQKKVEFTGIPVRPEIEEGDGASGCTLLEFKANQPIVLIMGGSLGAQNINNAVWESLTKLTKQAQILHITGRGKGKGGAKDSARYKRFEYVGHELNHYYAMADLVVSRAGANSIAEFQTLGKPMILIPLGLHQSRGDQIVNAKTMEDKGAAVVIPDDELTGDRLVDAVKEIVRSSQMRNGMGKNSKSDLHKKAAQEIADILKKKL